MDESCWMQGRAIGQAEREQIRQWLTEHPAWSRWQLSRHLAQAWNWRNAAGQLKDMAARTLLLKLEARGWLCLPPRRRRTFSRMRSAPAAVLTGPGPELRPAVAQPLAELLPLSLQEVSAAPSGGGRGQFAALLHRYHYLGYRSPVGENLQYLVADAQGRVVACVLFGAAAWQCADRDHWIGWSAAQRVARLPLLTNNTRFLILPWVQVPGLASHLLSRLAVRVSRDWQAKYGHPVHLLETFVERDRFRGTCYRAANWICVGQTKGRSRQDRADGQRQQVPIKAVYLYPLHPRFRERLRGPTTNPNPNSTHAPIPNTSPDSHP